MTNREVPGVGPTGTQRGGEEEVRVYYGSARASRAWRNGGRNARKMTEELVDLFHLGNQDNKKKVQAECQHIANVLLEFMHKSNNTKRKEA